MKWHSTKDKLPNHEQRVMVYIPHTNIYINQFNPIYIFCMTFYAGKHTDEGPWSFCDSGLGNPNNGLPYAWADGPMTRFSTEVTHWMPIPENPNVEDGFEGPFAWQYKNKGDSE